jgi:hypothetical protein
MKQSTSSVLAAAIERRKKTTPSKYVVKHVEATPEEMAYEMPADTSDPKKYPTLAVGRKEWLSFCSFRRGYFRLAPELRHFFKDEQHVNDALRHALAMLNAVAAKKKRKIA